MKLKDKGIEKGTVAQPADDRRDNRHQERPGGPR